MMAHEMVAKSLRRLGLPARGFSTNRVKVGGFLVTSSRASIDGLPWLHFGATTKTSLRSRVGEVNLVAALAGRIPALGVVVKSSEEVDYVRLPVWAFAALLRMVMSCDPKTVQTVLSEYLPMAVQIPPTDQKLGSGIVSNLEEDGQFSSSISDTD